MTDHWIETYKSLITISTEAFKFSALINGGAVIAILAYLGNVTGKSSAPDMRGAILPFLVGLVLCGVGWCASYLTQYTLFNEERPNGPRLPAQSHKKFLWAAAILYLCSLVAFCVGSLEAVSSFK